MLVCLRFASFLSHSPHPLTHTYKPRAHTHTKAGHLRVPVPCVLSPEGLMVAVGDGVEVPEGSIPILGCMP